MKTILLIAVFSIGVFLQAICRTPDQDTLLKNYKPYRIKSLAFQPIWFTTYNNQSALDNFQKLQTKSSVDKINLDGFTQSYNYTSNLTTGINLKASLINSNDYSRDIALDMTLFSAGILSAQYFMDTQRGVDTLYNAAGNIRLITDTTIRNTYEFNYSANFILINAAYRIKTNPNKRWVFYGGLGLGLGYSYLSGITTRNNEIMTVKDKRTNNVINSNDEDFFRIYTWERCRNSITTSLGLPVGIDFRLGDNNNIFKHTHLFFESKVGINLFFIPNSMFKPLITVQNGLGFKIDLF